MKVKLIAILDSCSEIYDGPVPVHNENVAMRNFVGMAMNPDTPIGKNPSDFSLWVVGEWNDAKGEVVPCVKRCLGYAVDLIMEGDDVNA